MATEKQIAANRINSQKSTGPITPQGKATTSMNAVTHGLCAKATVISHGDGRENGGEFQSLHSELRENLCPSGAMEEILVERIAILYWRQARSLKAEGASIRLSMDTYKRDYFNPAHHVGDKDWEERACIRKNGHKDIAELKFTLGCMENHAYPLEDLLDPNSCLLGDELELIYKLLLVNSKMPFKKEFIVDEKIVPTKMFAHIINESLDLERIRQDAIILLKAEITNKEDRHRTAQIEDERQLSLSQQFLSQPKGEDAEKIIRYEGFLSKEFYRALNELERLQRIRHGMPVPAPITVNIQTDTSN